MIETDIDTLIVKQGYALDLYEYGINSSEFSHTVDYKTIFTMCYDLVPARFRELTDLFSRHCSFIIIVKEGNVYELTNDVNIDDKYKGLLVNMMNQGVNDYVNKKGKDKNEIMSKMIENLALKY